MPSFSSVMMLSFSTIGIPCSGPLILPLARSSSSFLAIFNTSCFGATDINARNCLPLLLCCSISFKYNRTICTLVRACAFMSSESSKAEMVSGSKSGSHASSRGNALPILGASAVFRYLNTFGMAVLVWPQSTVADVGCGVWGWRYQDVSIRGDGSGVSTLFEERVRAVARLEREDRQYRRIRQLKASAGDVGSAWL
jgi:hypothetical protein